MEDSYEDRRRFPRVLFSVSDGVYGQYFIKGRKQELHTAYILNLSEDGLFFTTRKDNVPTFQKDDILNFLTLKIWKAKQLIINIEMKVAWVGQVDDYDDNVGVGCRFTKISDASRESIRKIVELKTGL
ncbi:MAG: PilZ domain-containing protein [Calditrichaceae bacterium]|nr:PilZ domain-containing protein [Calditrichaceae bacterium]MBN2710199.1 PilZ domain-containing protein [Calditrichaceae bacterium]